MNFQEAVAAWQADVPQLAARGVSAPDVVAYLTDEFKQDYTLAMDAIPALVTSPNAGVPAFLTTMIDPQVYQVLFSPNKAAKILSEVRKGTWVDQTAMFPVVEHTGEVSSYGDYNENGAAGANANWPQRQAYLFQTIKEYGELELERAGLGRLNWVTEIDMAAATVMNKYSNLTYFFGVSGMQNYGLLNDPNLAAALTPGTKTAGNGNRWMFNGAPNATANEVYADIQSLFAKLVALSGGLVEKEDKLVLACSPSASVALTITNSFNVSVTDLLKKNFPNIRFETAVQYGALSATNPQGVAAGEFVQLIAETVEGQEVGYCAFNEKMRAHAIIKGTSSFKQKVTAGTWGAIIRQPTSIAAMVGI